MSNIDGIRKRTSAILAAIEERRQPKPVQHLAYIIMTADGRDFPGCEESNARKRAEVDLIGGPLKCYIDLDPDEDGIEP